MASCRRAASSRDSLCPPSSPSGCSDSAGAGTEPIAGDFYDLLRLGDDRYGIVLGDVTGHGPTAASRMLALREATRAAAPGAAGPRALLHALDAYLAEEPDESLATLWYGEYRPSTGRLTYGSAGHPPPVLTCHGDPTRHTSAIMASSATYVVAYGTALAVYYLLR